VTIAPDARLFSPSPDHSTWVKPSTVSQRYERMCARHGWDMHIHQLRHYSATELITAGVDARTDARPRVRRRGALPKDRYQKIAADLCGAIDSGILKPGDYLPTIKELRERYKVFAGTAHRGIALLTSASLVTANRASRATVTQVS
jgi:hypothetical protein